MVLRTHAVAEWQSLSQRDTLWALSCLATPGLLFQKPKLQVWVQALDALVTRVDYFTYLNLENAHVPDLADTTASDFFRCFLTQPETVDGASKRSPKIEGKFS